MTTPALSDANYGTDTAATTDTSPVWGIASGTTNLAYSLVRRLSTPRGGLFYDLNYGTDLRAYVNRRISGAAVNNLPADISAECAKDDRVQATTETVAFTSQTRALTVAIEVQPIVGQAFTLILAATSVNVTLLSVNGISVSAATPTTSAAAVFLQGPAGHDGAAGAQGPKGDTGAGGTPQIYLDFDAEDFLDSSGVETVVYQRYVNFGPLPAMVTAELGGRVSSTAGAATFALRVGGTADTADGAIAVSMSTASNTPTPVAASNASFSNPGGWQLVKLTIASSAAGQTGHILNPTGSAR